MGYFLLALATAVLAYYLCRFLFKYVRLVADDMTSMELNGYGTPAVRAVSGDAELGQRPLWTREPRSARDSYNAIFESGGQSIRLRCCAASTRLIPRWRHFWLLLLWLHLANRGLGLGHARKA